MKRVELLTCGLRNRCSATELHRLAGLFIPGNAFVGYRYTPCCKSFVNLAPTRASNFSFNFTAAPS